MAYAHEDKVVPHGLQDYVPADKDCQEIYNLLYVNRSTGEAFVIQYRVYQEGFCSLSVKNLVEAVRILLTFNGYEYSKNWGLLERTGSRTMLVIGGDAEYDSSSHDFTRNEGNIAIITKRDGGPWRLGNVRLTSELTRMELIGLASELAKPAPSETE